ncbi:MAG: response regulator [Candidatus Anammoxibacter sp.]
MANILVVDDDECIHESFRIVLEPENIVDIASNGEECIAKIRINQPDIIFLDLKMPKVDGIEALIQLQTICPEVPKLIMTLRFMTNTCYDSKKPELVAVCLSYAANHWTTGRLGLLLMRISTVRLAICMCGFCHTRMLLSGIQKRVQPGFPLKTCGNDNFRPIT